MKMLLRKFLVASLLTGLLPLSSFAAGGDGGTVGGGGGYAKRNALSALNFISHDLASTIRGLPQASFPKLPSGWNQNKIADIIESIEPESGTLTKRDGDYLILDYDLNREKIMALAPFFWIYGSIGQKDRPTYKQYIDIQTKILHEVAHFWVGGDEVKADEFSDKVSKAINNNYVYCIVPNGGMLQGAIVNLSNGRAGQGYLPDLYQTSILATEFDLDKSQFERSGNSIHVTHYKSSSHDIDWELTGEIGSEKGFDLITYYGKDVNHAGCLENDNFRALPQN